MTFRREVARHHTVVFTLIRNPGIPDRRLHTLYLIPPEGSPEPLIPLVEYFIEIGRSRSLAWQKETARAVGLLVDFLVANHKYFQQQEGPQAFAAFAEALVGGTISQDGKDPSGLFWEPKSVSRATRLLQSVTAFSDWLVNRYGTKAINPWRDASVAEQIAFWRRLDNRKAYALLGYARYRSDLQEQAGRSRRVSIQRKSITSGLASVKAFPSEHIWDLLLKGFTVPGKQRSPFLFERLNIRDVLITILMHGGGLRESEPFHLYVSDVGIDPENPRNAFVRLYHPEQGAAPPDYTDPVSGKRIFGDREEYLRVKWQLQPRNLVEGRFKAGWKDLQLFDHKEKYALVHWFPSYWGEAFLAFFKLYILHCRSRHSRHPYLFVSYKEAFEGEPYTVDSFRQAHARAVKRIGLIPSKDCGTTPHGHRHAYGRSLADAGVSPIIIQRIMHHKSPESQGVYTEPTAAGIAAALNDAQQRLICSNEPWADIARRDDGLCKLLDLSW